MALGCFIVSVSDHSMRAMRSEAETPAVFNVFSLTPGLISVVSFISSRGNNIHTNQILSERKVRKLLLIERI